MVKVNGKKLPKQPSSLTWGKQDISAADAGRTEQNDRMYKNRTSEKRKLSLGWVNTTPEETAEILQMFNEEYFWLTYSDALTGKEETKEFYCGDMTAPIKAWTGKYKRYTSVSFDVIER